MDIATVIGFVGTMGLIAWAMDSAAGIGAFIDTSSVVIVFAGSIMVLLTGRGFPIARAFLPSQPAVEKRQACPRAAEFYLGESLAAHRAAPQHS